MALCMCVGGRKISTFPKARDSKHEANTLTVIDDRIIFLSVAVTVL